MPRFFVTASQIGVRDNGQKTVLIMGEDASHITRSLRMKAGEKITVCDMARVEYECEIMTTGETVCALVLSEETSKNEPPYEATLYQALIKGDKFDTVVQKAVECGVCRIVPVLTDRCIVRLNKAECRKKILRWQRIADEAAKQCGRGSLVTVCDMMTFKEAVAAAAKDDLSLFCYEGESAVSVAKALSEAENCPEKVSFMIGSEGGFSTAEAALAVEGGMKSVTLGSRILRTETASSFLLACLSYEFEMEE
ncbi:MAG: 16S rRNA (uracil(1498)-N(3))-methyltransferase [Ruminococcaceae bacterium]|nr:16S rRNA (uracil(1498)-N(3))-methyltransferase [Oscillospiraceae bacterium]